MNPCGIHPVGQWGRSCHKVTRERDPKATFPVAGTSISQKPAALTRTGGSGLT